MPQGFPVTFDEQLRKATDHAVAGIHTQLEAEVRGLVQQLLQAAGDERVRAIAEAREAVADETRAEADATIRAQLAAAQAQHDRTLADAVDRTRTDGHQSELAHASQLLEWVRALDDCGTLTEVLDTLAQAAAAEAPRAALLVVRDQRLQGWCITGFDVADARAIELAADAAGIAGDAARGSVRFTATFTGPQDEGAAPLFARRPQDRVATATPVLVGGQPVAVVYAEAPRSDTPSAASRWPAIVEVLARHAGRCLEALAATRALGGVAHPPRAAVHPVPAPLPGPFDSTGSSDTDAARRHARLLISEIRLFHEQAIDAGRRERDLAQRLGPEIDRARRLYEARVPEGIRARHDYFEQELVRTLADGDRTVLG